MMDLARSPQLQPADAHARYRARRHFGSLDGLRFICISAVIWHHLPLWQTLDGPGTLLSRGQVGVDFFFVLSGYLITTLLLREEAANGQFSLRQFYWRRALRILPIYLLVVGIAAGWSIGVQGHHDYLGKLPYYLLFLSNFLQGQIPFLDPTWSLAIEEQYYLIWPALLALVPRRWIVALLLGLIAVNVLAAAGVFNRLGLAPVYVGQLKLGLYGSTYAPILMGSLAAVLLHGKAGYERIAPWVWPRPAPWLWFLALLALLGLYPSALEGFPNLAVHLLMTMVVMALVVREDNGMRPLLTLRPIARIGQVSYGIYLYHLFALAITGRAMAHLGIANWWLMLILYYALAVAMAEVSYRSLERYFLGLRYRAIRPERAGQEPHNPRQ